MSKFNKASVIAVAIAAAIAAPAAYAVTASGATTTINSNQFGSATANVTVPDFSITADSSDVYLGRTAGYSVKVTLPAGVTINTLMTDANVEAAGNAESATLVTGTGAANSNTFTVLVVPDAGEAGDVGPPVVPARAAGTKVGEGFTVKGLSLKGVAGTLGAGGSLNATITVLDPTTGSTLGSTSGTLVKSAEGLSVKFTPNATAEKIDVGVGGTDTRKIFFVDDAATPAYGVGEGDAAIAFTGGSIDIAEATGVDAWLAALVAARATVTMTGDFSAYKALAAADQGDYYQAPVATLNGENGTISTDGKTLTFTNVDLNGNAATGSATNSLELVLKGNGTTEIQPTAISVTAVIDPDGSGTAYRTTTVAGSLSPIEYNGAVVKLYNVNPASNQVQESLLRYTNPTAVPLNVTLTGVDDAGKASTGSATFTLPAYGSISLRSVEIENGSGKLAGSLGAPTSGKWIITATAEGSELIASGLNRSNSTGVISELNSEKGHNLPL